MIFNALCEKYFEYKKELIIRSKLSHMHLLQMLTDLVDYAKLKKG